MSSLLADPLLLLAYLSIPLMSGLVGWGTNWLALKMTFHPLEPLGWPPLFGWQGIVPSQAPLMASRSVKLMTSKLMRPEDIVAKLDPRRIAELMGPALRVIVRKTVDELAEKYAGRVWRRTPSVVKDRIYKRVLEDSDVVTEQVADELRDRSVEVFDLEDMVIKALVRDKALLNEMFLRCGEKELKFIEWSGLYLGFLFGVLQMAVWALAPQWWVLPLAGFLVGYLTNLLALKMIFQPVKPRRYGPFVVQGLFLKRQREVSAEYAKLNAAEILNTRNILQAIVRGPAADRVLEVIARHIDEGVDRSVGAAQSLFELVAGSDRYDEIKETLTSRVFDQLPDQVKRLEVYAEKAMDLENTLREKLSELPPEEFAGVLRPVFQQDEWKLILVGAVLGTGVGVFQLLVVFGGTV